LHEIVELLVTANLSDLQLVRVPYFVKGLEVTSDREILSVLHGAICADVGAVGDVGMGAAVVLAVNAESIEFILLNKVVYEGLLLVRLGDDRKIRLHISLFI
jgi:hypothetical protein